MSVQYDITAEQLQSGGYRVLHAGDDYDHSFTLQQDSVAIDLTNGTVWFTVKESSVEEDTDALLAYDSGTPTDLEITDAAAGELTVHFQAADTANLEGQWLYDLQVKLQAGTVITMARGTIEFLENLTRSTS